MPRRCCVPGCNSNYDSFLLNNSAVSAFTFPKDDIMRRKWIYAIPRQNWSPTVNTVVCIKHFHESEVTKTSKRKTTDGTIVEAPLKKPNLNKEAIPSIFDNLPAYLSKFIIKRKDPQVRRDAITDKNNSQIEDFLKSDLIDSFDDLVVNHSIKFKNCSWSTKMTKNRMYFYLLNVDSPDYNNYIDFKLEIVSTIYVNTNMHLKVVHKNIEIPAHDLLWILPTDSKLSRWSQLENLLDRYKLTVESLENNNSANFYLNKSFQYFEEALSLSDKQNSSDLSKLEIISDQILQLKEKRPRYSSNTIIFSFFIYTQSSSCYNLLRNFLTLPHKRYLSQISSSFNISPESNKNNIHYLSQMCNNLNEREKIVCLVIDEIHIKSGLHFKAQCIRGQASNNVNELAKSIHSFMITSAFGSLKEIVRLIPASTITGEYLKQATVEVIDFIQNIGFKIVCIITDNNRINQNLFKLLSNNNTFFCNPKYSDEKIFLMYDTVHIIKNIRNNWLNLKNQGKTFVFPNFEINQSMQASFHHLRDLYNNEKTLLVKQAYKLNVKSLFPNNLERQDVRSADNIFHDSTVAALKSVSAYHETAYFLELIRKWWNIVNVKSKFKGIAKKNDFCSPITTDTDEKILFLYKFVTWLDMWNSMENKVCLTKDTFNAIRQSTVVLIELIQYSFKNYAINYVLTGKFQSDNLERRFGQYRSLSGCNYNISYVQVVESEKKIRLRHLLTHRGPRICARNMAREPGGFRENDTICALTFKLRNYLTD